MEILNDGNSNFKHEWLSASWIKFGYFFSLSRIPSKGSGDLFILGAYAITV